MQHFHKVLINTLIFNVVTGFLAYSLLFWVYLETRNVALAGILNAGYMGALAVTSIFFGSIVDHNRKKTVMMASSCLTLVFFALAGVVWVVWMDTAAISLDSPALWVFSILILIGSIVEHLRNIALSTVVTLLVPEDRRDKANGLVGVVHGMSFLVTSMMAGMSIGFFGMETTLWVCLVLTLLAVLHLITVEIPEPEIVTQHADATVPMAPAPSADGEVFTPTPVPSDLHTVSQGLDIRGSLAIIRGVPGLLALILFTCFNNLVGGVYTALMDPYGLELFSPQLWGVMLGLTGLGFIIGGMVIARVGLGSNPVRTLLLVNVGIAIIGIVFTIREWGWLFVAGIFVFMLITPAAEATEQTILQRVVPFRQQGRVFGLAMAVEMGANPLSAVIVAVVAQAYLIPWMDGPGADSALGVLLGDGTARGMALMFMLSGVITLIVVLLAFASRPYRQLSRYYALSSQDIAGQATTAQ